MSNNMKNRFKRKIFTIPEGHFTGQKDMPEMPSLLHNMCQGAKWGGTIGMAAGGLHEKLVEDNDMPIDGTLSGGVVGAGIGIASGIMLKFFQNYMHKPLKSIKFQEVDRNIRKQFGMYRIAGISVGDSINNRMTMDEKFSFNDRNVADYKINIAIQNNIVTMYTFGMSDKELSECSKILDFYAQKYYGVNYTAKLINRTVNSYSVDISFTNYNIITNFIMELSQILQTKINMMNENAIITGRLQEAANKDNPMVQGGSLTENPSGNSYGNGLNSNSSQRNFSEPELSKTDIAKILGQGGQVILSRGKLKTAGAATILELVKTAIDKITDFEAIKLGIKLPSKNELNNDFLKGEIKRLHYMEKIHYTIGDKEAVNNMSLVGGRLIITTPTGEDDQKTIDKTLYQPLRLKMTKSNTGDVTIYSYNINSLTEFTYVLNKLFSTKIKFNIFV